MIDINNKLEIRNKSNEIISFPSLLYLQRKGKITKSMKNTFHVSRIYIDIH